VIDIIQTELTVVVLPSSNLKPPYFSSTGIGCGDKIARQMRLLLEQENVPVYLDENAKLLVNVARQVARLSGAVGGSGFIVEQKGVRFFPWAGSKIHTTLWALAKSQDLTVAADRLSILYRDVSLEQVLEHFDFIAKSQHDPTALAELLPVKAVQKFDGYLTDELLNIANAQRLLEIKETVACTQEALSFSRRQDAC
jgi:hypothetical protein